MKQSLLVSLVAHILVLAGVALWPRTGVPKRPTTITIQQIRLERPPEPVVTPQAPPPRVEPPPQRPPKQKIFQQRIARLLESHLRKRRLTPKPRPTPARREKTPTPVRRKRPPTATPTPPRLVRLVRITEAESPTTTPVVQPKWTPTLSGHDVVFDEGFNYQSYVDRLMRTLRRNWDPPPWQPEWREGIYTVISFTIQANGSVVGADIEVPSGWRDLDESALRAVRRSHPVEPLPREYGRSTVRAHVRFKPFRP